MSAALLAALHYLGAMVMMACLVAEHLLLRPELEPARVRSLARIDAIYGLVALIQLAGGLARMAAEKGVDFYLHNPLFHLKMSAFVVLGLLSIYPTMRIMRWRRAVRSSGLFMPADFRRVQLLVRLEIFVLALLPVLASLMARGVG